MENVLVVGAGMAGLQTVVQLREQGYTGRLTLLGAEPHAPYDRPPLSKDVLVGKTDDTAFEADFAAMDVQTIFGRTATGLRLNKGTEGNGEGGEVDTDAGPVPFDRLVIATGSRVVNLPGADEVPGVHTLRTIDDARALRAALVPGAHVVVVGAGWIGAEVASSAAALGCRVTVVEALHAPLAGAFPDEIGARFVPWYAEAGVELLLDARVDRLEPGAVHLTDGRRLPADAIVVGIGVRPETGWLADSGVDLDPRGCVVVDDHLHTSAPGVYAVGDCTVFDSARYAARLHVEHWDNALQAPRTVAANLLGGDAAYDPVPYFWSDQFGRMVQYVGHHPVGEDLVIRGPGEDGKWTAGWFRGDALVALLTVARPRDLAQGRKLVTTGAPVDRAKFADIDVQLKDAGR
ncbi:NAD(P)/FAD-dependent oxidoreductase [Yinghuangia seranimata]|uniref:NAD(P)/FAD-dependent oxidoreductase n=1 Tax=Yinghuangia seranimata TaxID=408067 RepID=UPI00248B047E|nr:FAD-dependent oxidoreductase [Yinghuangia seranimata]MDI2126147.1 FAD-dependent oxidoreductase [Yinghuangia seranimata]